MSLAAQVLELMAHEAEALATLKELLLREHAALEVRDVAVLQEIAAAKASPIERLDGFAAERAKLLATEGLSADAAGFDAFLAKQEAPDSTALQEKWAAVAEELRACQRQNRINGLLLDASMRATQEALSVLLGQGTYNSQGTLRTSHGSLRTFAKV